MIRNKCLHKVINQVISILAVCAAHAHAELSVELCLAAFITYPVQQLFVLQLNNNISINDCTGSNGTGQ